MLVQEERSQRAGPASRHGIIQSIQVALGAEEEKRECQKQMMYRLILHLHNFTIEHLIF